MNLSRFLPVFFLLWAHLSAATSLATTAPQFQETVVSLVVGRASSFSSAEFLPVDYYRIYHRLAYPLPIRTIDQPSIQVSGIGDYPWEIWLLWALEERISSLGWAGTWTENPAFRAEAKADLEALASWKSYNVEANPHLSVGHSARLLEGAYNHWPWLGDPLRSRIREACFRLVEEQSAWFRQHRAGLETVEKIRSSPVFRNILHNIPVIATLGLSMAARVSNHPLRDELESHCAALIHIGLDARLEGITEGIAYDGYILDFVADWMAGASPALRSAIGSRPEWKKMLEEAAFLSVPGAIADYAPLHDVEPREMPFHVSAASKLAALGYSSPLLQWYLGQYPLERARVDALAALHQSPPAAAPQPGTEVFQGLSATALRSGWTAEDTAVVVSSTASPSGHMQRANGTLVIGRQGRWWIDDPGYQQYMEGEERTFTLGPTAHNYPVVNGALQAQNAVRRLACNSPSPEIPCLALDFTEGYPESAGIVSAKRTVWLAGRNLVVVGDVLEAPPVARVAYTWHAPREAALWAEQGTGLIHIEGSPLWIRSSLGPVRQEGIRRLSGTRGQVSFQVEGSLDGPRNVVWWVFSFGPAPSSLTLGSKQEELVIEGQTYSTLD